MTELDMDIAEDLPIINNCKACEGRGSVIMGITSDDYKMEPGPVMCGICMGVKTK